MKIYGEWTILRKMPSIKYNGQTKRRVRCKCSCGVTKTVQLATLISGKSTSCGNCTWFNIKPDKYNDLTIIPNVVFWKYTKMYVFARCICGSEKPYPYKEIISGNKKNCGCVKITGTKVDIENIGMVTVNEATRILGMSKQAIYSRIERGTVEFEKNGRKVSLKVYHKKKKSSQ